MAGDGHLVEWLIDASMPLDAATTMTHAGGAESIAILNGMAAALERGVDEGAEVAIGMIRIRAAALAGLDPLIDGCGVEGGDVDKNGHGKWILVFRNPLRSVKSARALQFFEGRPRAPAETKKTI
jgi:hypothetical protein